jgi:thiamine kinase
MSAPEQEWTLQDVQRFLARNRPDLGAIEIDFLRGGYWNHVFKVTAPTGAFVLKRYRKVLADSLFPNLPDNEALALQRLAGLGVAPDFVSYWPEAKVLLYRYVEGGAWKGDPTPIADLLRRKEAVGCEGFRRVPVEIADILGQGDKLFERCAADEMMKAFKRQRSVPMPLTAPKKLSLIHTDIGAGNLIGVDNEYRIIDWQCPAAGDVTEDVYSFLSPAFQILNHCAPIDEAGVSRFFSALDRPAIVERYRALRPAFAYRMGGYCCLRLQTAPPAEAELIERYVRAAKAELIAMKAP